jgi:hypothetical protein
MASLTPRWAAEGVAPDASSLRARPDRGWSIGRAIGRIARYFRPRATRKAAAAPASAGSSDAFSTPMAYLPHSWSCTMRLMPLPSVPSKASLTAVTLYRERRANRGAAYTLMMLPLTLVPPSIASPWHGQPPSTYVGSRRPSTHARAVEFAAGPAREWPEHRAGGQARLEAWPVERRGVAARDTSVAVQYPMEERSTVDSAMRCRAQRGHDALQAGDLARAQAELADVDFARSEAGVALQCAVAQRAIYLGDAARAVAIFTALKVAGHALQSAEYRQWFALLLQLRKLDAAHALQDAHAELQAPLQQLAMAHAMADAGREPELMTYLASRQPAFTREVQERQWLYLLTHVEARRPDLLARFRVRFAANRDVQERLASTGALARNGQGAARHALAPVAAAGGFSEARFGLAMRAGRFDEAQRWCPRAEAGVRVMHSVA